MNNQLLRDAAKLRRVKQFGDDHPNVPANPAADAEYAAIGNAITQFEEMAEAQSGGSATITGAVRQRLTVVDQMLELMSSLAKAAKVLDAATHPDVATKMRMSGINNFEELVARANLFHSTLQPIEAEFIALGASATVAADLQALITAVQGAWDQKLTGLDTQIGGTAGLKQGMKAALKRVRKLDAILSQLYRANPVLLAQWKAARRTERASQPAENPAGGSEGSGGGGSTPPVGS